jgi:hypothetical protein
LCSKELQEKSFRINRIRPINVVFHGIRAVSKSATYKNEHQW